MVILISLRRDSGQNHLYLEEHKILHAVIVRILEDTYKSGIENLDLETF